MDLVKAQPLKVDFTHISCVVLLASVVPVNKMHKASLWITNLMSIFDSSCLTSQRQVFWAGVLRLQRAGEQQSDEHHQLGRVRPSDAQRWVRCRQHEERDIGQCFTIILIPSFWLAYCTWNIHGHNSCIKSFSFSAKLSLIFNSESCRCGRPGQTARENRGSRYILCR